MLVWLPMMYRFRIHLHVPLSFLLLLSGCSGNNSGAEDAQQQPALDFLVDQPGARERWVEPDITVGPPVTLTVLSSVLPS